MKRLFLILLFLFLSAHSAFALPRITDDFYLNNRKLSDSDAVDVMSILPNTLRVELLTGESCELYVELLPDNATETELSWSVVNGGIVKIFPDGARCRVQGVGEGCESIEIIADSGAVRSVEIAVKKPKVLSARNSAFEKAREPTEKAAPRNVIAPSVRVLTACGTTLTLGTALIYSLKRRFKKNEEGN